MVHPKDRSDGRAAPSRQCCGTAPALALALLLGEMDPATVGTAEALLAASLSEDGFRKVEAIARRRMERVEDELPRVRFLWMGDLEPGEGHHYRIRGASFLVEHDSTQDGANHVHSVWRDLSGEWGRDPLAEHYRTAPHHADRWASLGR